MEAISHIDQISRNEYIYIAPAGGAAERFFSYIRKVRPDINILGYLDTFKSTVESGGNVTRIDNADHTQKHKTVIVVIEKENIRKKIINTLNDNNFEKVFWLSPEFNASKDDCITSDSTLYLFYDLSTNTLTFEFLNALANADAERKAQKKEKLHIVIIPQGDTSIFDFSRQSIIRNNGNASRESNNHWFLHNVVIPSISLAPSCSGLTLCGTRAEASALTSLYSGNLFPETYSVDKPIELQSSYNVTNTDIYDGNGYGTPFSSSDTALSFVSEWLHLKDIDPGKLIVITVRQYSLEQERNTNIAEWTCFAEHILEMGFTPVFIKDTYTAFGSDKLDDYIVFAEASWNIQLRMAIYEHAFLNMIVNTGPVTLCMYNSNVRYLNFIHVSEETYAGSREYLEAYGHRPGDQYPAHNKFQKWVWTGSEDCSAILDEFNRMCAVIEKNE